MTTSPRPQPLLDWLRDQRYDNQLWRGLMSVKFDLDGALSAGQRELADRVGRYVVLIATEMYARRCGLAYDDVGDDPIDRACTVLDVLGRVDPVLADEVWGHLLDSDAPAGPDGVADRIGRAFEFTTRRLGVDATSRGPVIRAWADSVALLRDVARDHGLARSDGWYLTGRGDPGEPSDWYEHVLGVLDDQM